MPEHHPVDDLDQIHFDQAARLMAAGIRFDGFGYIELCPGDATIYKMMMGRTPTATPQHTLLFASNFGPLYPWSPANSDFTSWDYCLEHFLLSGHRNSSGWTARVFSRFLNTLRPLLIEE